MRCIALSGAAMSAFGQRIRVSGATPVVCQDVAAVAALWRPRGLGQVSQLSRNSNLPAVHATGSGLLPRRQRTVRFVDPR